MSRIIRYSLAVYLGLLIAGTVAPRTDRAAQAGGPMAVDPAHCVTTPALQR
jgi:hypothetical protein